MSATATPYYVTEGFNSAHRMPQNIGYTHSPSTPHPTFPHLFHKEIGKMRGRLSAPLKHTYSLFYIK